MQKTAPLGHWIVEDTTFVDLPLLRTLPLLIYLCWEHYISNLPRVPRSKFLESDAHFYFISICKFGSFKNPFASIISLSELYLRFILLVQTKRWFLWTMKAAQAAEKHGDEWGLIWYFLWRIYTSIPTWTHSQNSLAAEALSLKISSHGTSLKYLRD